MTLESFRNFCLSLKATSEGLPFDETTLVFKVCGKIFAICDLNDFNSVALKCDPEYALELRAQYDYIKPGYHLNKKHWNTVELTNDITDAFLKELVLHSYDCVVKKLTKKERQALEM